MWRIFEGDWFVKVMEIGFVPASPVSDCISFSFTLFSHFHSCISFTL